MRSIAPSPLLSSPLLLVTALATLGAGAGCGGGTRACKQGTLFVTVTFPGATSAADHVRVAVRIDDGAEKATVLPRTVGASQDTIEIDFPNGYPAGKRVDVEIQALLNAVSLAMSKGFVTPLPDGCGALAIALPEGNPVGSGGTGGTGGGAAGRGGGGGSTGGGAAGRGGTGGGTAGRGGTGGSTGGGAAGRGGTGGSTAGAGGRGGAGGTTVVGPPACRYASFDTAAEGFVLNPFNTDPGNLLFREAGAVATIAWNGAEGAPAAGSLKIDAPFSDYNQLVDLTKSLTSTGRPDWTGGKLHVRVKIASGLNQSPQSPPSVQVYALSYNPGDGGLYHWKGSYTTVSTGNLWTDYALDLAAEGDFDPSNIDSIGVVVSSGPGLVNGTVNPLKPTAAVIYVDSVWLEGASCTGPTGGFGGGTTCGASWAVSNEGFVTAPGAGAGCWHGYGYTGGDLGSTISPVNFFSCGANCTLKLVGMVGPATMANNYAGFAYVGFGLGQDALSGVMNPVTPAGTGVTITFSNGSGAGLVLRAELEGSSMIWCYTITGPSPVTIPYAMFNTACWDGTGTYYQKQPINRLRLTVSGAPTAMPLSLTLMSVKEN